MKVLVVDNFAGKAVVITTDFIPRVGDRLDLFYAPHPTVLGVLAWPSKKTLAPLVESTGMVLEGIDAIITTGTNYA